MRAVFLDRDGVLNKCPAPGGKPVPPPDAAALEFFEDALSALTRLKNEGYVLICVTNQPDVARGTRTLDNVNAMNEKVRAALPLDALYVCLHDTRHNCECRKPKPGMLLRGAREFNLDLRQCYMVGDRASDIMAGYNAGCRTIFIDHAYSEACSKIEPDCTCRSLTQATQWILGNQ